MGILDALCSRLGYVKLDDYGLVRTADDRIATLHRSMLDDGAGGRVVGWRAEDPAPAQLAPMELVRPKDTSAVTSRARVTTEDGADDDEWAWQLALVRARAAAEDAEAAAASIKPARIARGSVPPSSRVMSPLKPPRRDGSTAHRLLPLPAPANTAIHARASLEKTSPRLELAPAEKPPRPRSVPPPLPAAAARPSTARASRSAPFSPISVTSDGEPTLPRIDVRAKG
jgi:hypothetical protein